MGRSHSFFITWFYVLKTSTVQLFFQDFHDNKHKFFRCKYFWKHFGNYCDIQQAVFLQFPSPAFPSVDLSRSATVARARLVLNQWRNPLPTPVDRAALDTAPLGRFSSTRPRLRALTEAETEAETVVVGRVVASRCGLPAAPAVHDSRHERTLTPRMTAIPIDWRASRFVRPYHISAAASVIWTQRWASVLVVGARPTPWKMKTRN